MSEPKFTTEEWISQPCESICSDYEVTTKERELAGLSPIFSIDILDDELSEEQNANLSLLQQSKNMYKEIEQDILWLRRLSESYVIGSHELRSIHLRIKSKEQLLKLVRGE